jgi:alkanesulfonate monooxygenase SsuD/methylene tetrahydromethanopterin reductase-like flavin-dependent oxidoreductase (luciferase family)
MARTALAFSVMPDSPLEKIAEWTRDAEEMGYAAVFMTEANNDSVACSLALGMQTQRIGLGTAITNIYLRHPALLANEAATVHQFTGGRFMLGLGTGHGEGNSRLGSRWGSQWRRCARPSRRCARCSKAVAPGPK